MKREKLSKNPYVRLSPVQYDALIVLFWGFNQQTMFSNSRVSFNRLTELTVQMAASCKAWMDITVYIE